MSDEVEEFSGDARAWANHWDAQLKLAGEARQQYVTQGRKVDRVFRDERDASEEGKTKWNLYTADTLTLLAMLYGNTPKSSVSRRFGDAQDDVARLAAELAERNLHTDLERPGSVEAEAYGNALQDWRIPGGGFARVRYAAEFEKVPAVDAVLHPETGLVLVPEVPEGERVSKEEAPVDYVHWEDFFWSPARFWSEVTWIAFASDMPKADFVKRFGLEAWKKVPKQSKREKREEKERDPAARARVWEIWHRDLSQPVVLQGEEAGEDEATEGAAHEAAEGEAPTPDGLQPLPPPKGRVFWHVEGHSEVLDVKEDPLRLEGFWPCPKPLFATVTTSKLMPRSDYYFAQDLYLELNDVSTRIRLLQEALRVAGAYDAANPELARLLDSKEGNLLVPVANWGALAEKGGMRGALDFLPLDIIAAALTQLRDYRRELIDAIYQVTGRADIMRGQASAPGASATEQAVKARFGSVRVQRMQDEFARFVSETQALKLEVISKHFRPETILERANAQYAFTEADKRLLPQAVQLLKSQWYCYRVEVKPESIALTDFAQLKSDRTEVIGALSTFFQAAAPVAQAVPGSMPFLLQLLQASVAGLKGSSTLEGVLDAAIQAAEEAEKQKAANPQPPPPDPKLQAQQLKGQQDAQKAQMDMQKQELKHQQDLEKLQAETAAHDAQEASQARWNTKEAMDKALLSRALKPPEAPKPGGLP